MLLFRFLFAYYTAMSAALPQLPILSRVLPASSLPTVRSNAPAWDLADLAGRLVELSAGDQSAHLTAAFGLVLDAQLSGESAAWVTLEHSSFFPPDVADGGIDLDALPVVRVPDVRMAGRAADHLVQSGGFGLVVIDISGIRGERKTERTRSTDKISAPLLTRLMGQARQRNVAVLFLTKKSSESPALHSLISLRVEARWERRAESQYELSVRPLKDKRSSQPWTHVEMCRGPAGLR